MKYESEKIISELIQQIEYQLDYLENKVLPLETLDLEWRPSEYRWNIYEVVEHLIRFGEFYIPKMKHILAYPKAINKKDVYKSGIFSEVVLKRIKPLDGVIVNKAKSSPKNNPFLRQLNRSVILEYIEQQKQLMKLLKSSTSIDLSKNHIPTIITSYLRLNFGDSLRLLIYHEERHFIQIDNLVHKRFD